MGGSGLSGLGERTIGITIARTRTRTPIAAIMAYLTALFFLALLMIYGSFVLINYSEPILD